MLVWFASQAACKHQAQEAARSETVALRRNVKFSSMINQESDETRLPMEQADIEHAYATYRRVMGAHPAPQEEVTGDQLTA
eukprot:4864679-Amphidinium_carterae.1